MRQYSCYIDQNYELRVLKRDSIHATGIVPTWTDWEPLTQDDLVEFAIRLRNEQTVSYCNYN